MKRFVGIDIGATNLRVALSDKSGKVLKLHSEKTQGKFIIKQISTILNSFEDFEGVGISSVGPLDSHRGVIINPPNVEIKNVKIVKELERKFEVPTYLLNDCVAAVVGEKFIGAGKKFKNIVYITLSTGIGSGVIMDNRLILGKDGNGHEVGHNTLDFESKLRCGCGGYGHWESFCAGKNIPKYAEFLLKTVYKNQKSSLLKNSGKLDAKEIFNKAKSDRVAMEITRRIAKINAVGIGNIINAYDPELITIGGSVMLNNSELLLKIIKEEVQNYTINRMPKILVTPLGHDICTTGAVASIINREFVMNALEGKDDN